MPHMNTSRFRSSKAEKQRNRKRRQRTQLMVVLLSVSCIGALMLMPLMNTAQTGRQYASTKADDVWYVADGSIQIEAVTRDTAQNMIDENNPVKTTPTPLPLPASTAIVEETEGDDLSSLPFIAEMETPEPTLAPTLPVQDVLVDATATPRPEGQITITAVGDCTLGGNTNGSGGEDWFAAYVNKQGYDYFFNNVRSLFESDDLTIVNLEGPLTTSTDKRANRTFNFRGDPSYVNILSGSSVEICNIANNHAFDFGMEGFRETKAVLAEAGIGASGFTAEYYTQVNGYTVGSLGFTKWDNSVEEIAYTVAAAKRKCDLLIVSMHWGEEGSHVPSAQTQAMGKAIVDAGADLVIGTHTHVYGGVSQYKGKYIIYSLGNFCFGGNRYPSSMNCLIFQQTFHITPDGNVSDGGINIIPARVSTDANSNNFQPMILEGDAGVSLLHKIAAVSALPASNVLWMHDSYEQTNGLVTLNSEAAVDAGGGDNVDA